MVPRLFLQKLNTYLVLEFEIIFEYICAPPQEREILIATIFEFRIPGLRSSEGRNILYVAQYIFCDTYA